MQITAVCPECLARYQLNDDLLGRSMKCRECQTVFVIQADGSVPPVNVSTLPKPSSATTPEGGFKPTDTPAASQTRDWRDTPPPVPKASPEVRDWRDAPPPAKNSPSSAPPIKPKPASTSRNGEDQPIKPLTQSVPNFAELVERQRRNNQRWMLAGILACVLTVLAGGSYWVYQQANWEANAFLRVQTLIEEGKYAEARNQLRKLTAQVPENAEYAYLLSLTEARAAVDAHTSRANPSEAIELTRKYLGIPNEVLTKKYRAAAYALVETLTSLLLEQADKAIKAGQNDEATAWIDQAEKMVPDARRLASTDEAPAAAKLSELASILRKQIARAKQLAVIVDKIRALLADSTDSVTFEQAEALAAADGFAQEPAVRAVIDEARRRTRQLPIYAPDFARAKRIAEPDYPGLLIAPQLRGQEAQLGGSGVVPRIRPDEKKPGIIFAVARGLLYALEEQQGRVLWATRVGIDAGSLPVSVDPESEAGRELGRDCVLILTQDGTALSARHPANGELYWQQPLGGTALGRPVLLGPRVYVALDDEVGTICEYEVIAGSRLGRFTLRQRLACGPVVVAGRLFCPAHRDGIFIIDPENSVHDRPRKPHLFAVLPTGHAAGTLRVAPQFYCETPDSWPTMMLLALTDGLEQTRLAVYKLPKDPSKLSEPLSSPVEVRLRGWLGFEPFSDGERIAAVTDAGIFGLFGLNQIGNSDAPIFALPRAEKLPEVGTLASRGQVVMANESGYWVLVRGQLHYLQLALERHFGQTLLPGWRDPVTVGVPLHESQRNATGDTLFLVTQEGAVCAATAINTASGLVRWKRQLGLTGGEDPVRVGSSVVLQDASGGLYRVEPSKYLESPESEWKIAEKIQVAKPLEGIIGRPWLVTTEKGDRVFGVAVDRFEGGPKSKQAPYRLRITAVPGTFEKFVYLTAPLAGKPIMLQESFILPLADGTFRRLGLSDQKPSIPEDSMALADGLSWRAERLNENTEAHLAALGPTEFVSLDGRNRLTHWRWTAGQSSIGKFNRVGPDLVLPASVRISPIVLSPNIDSAARLAIADETGAVHLYESSAKLGGQFPSRPSRTWRLPEQAVWLVAFGEDFAVGGHAGSLFWLNANRDGILWTCRTPGLAGKPVRQGDVLYVADTAGTVRKLAVENGKPFGEANLPLPEGTTAAAAAIPLPGYRLFVPLTDGSLIFPGIRETLPIPRVQFE